MRRRIALFLLAAQVVLICTEAHAYWVWTPRTGRWINPKTQPKDSPQDQLDHAGTFYESKDYKRALKEYLRLVRFYPKSSQAPDAQFYVGQCYEAMEQPYSAFLAYKKLVEIYPYSARFKDATARSFAIGEALYEGEKVRPIQQVPVAFPALDKAVEIFQHIVLQAPYGEFGDKAQFRLGQSLRKLGQYGEALKAFEKVIQEYKLSPLVEDARYNVAFCAKQMSLKPGYDQESTDQAIAWFEEFIQNHQGSELLPEAERSLVQLRGYKAEGIYKVAEFYRRQKKWRSAAIYYNRIVNEYGDTAQAGEAVARLTELEQSGRLSGDPS